MATPTACPEAHPSGRVSPATTTVYTATGDPIEVPLLDLRCRRCRRPWEWPRGLDPDLDRADRESATAECPACIDELADLRLADFPWEDD